MEANLGSGRIPEINLIIQAALPGEVDKGLWGSPGLGYMTGNVGKEKGQNEKTRMDRFDYGLGFKRMRMLWHLCFNKTGLD